MLIVIVPSLRGRNFFFSGKADAPVDWGDMSVEQLTDMIDHLLRIRQDREVHSEPGAAIASATGATGGSTVSSPSPVATITTTVTTPAQGSHQNTATTQTVIIPLIYREPTITPGHQPSATTPETPGTARPRVTLASRVHTNGWYCVARAREVGVIYDWSVDDFCLII